MKCQGKVTNRPQNFTCLPAFTKVNRAWDHKSQWPSITLMTACNKSVVTPGPSSHPGVCKWLDRRFSQSVLNSFLCGHRLHFQPSFSYSMLRWIPRDEREFTITWFPNPKSFPVHWGQGKQKQCLLQMTATAAANLPITVLLFGMGC